MQKNKTPGVIVLAVLLILAESSFILYIQFSFFLKTLVSKQLISPALFSAVTTLKDILHFFCVGGCSALQFLLIGFSKFNSNLFVLQALTVTSVFVSVLVIVAAGNLLFFHNTSRRVILGFCFFSFFLHFFNIFYFLSSGSRLTFTLFLNSIALGCFPLFCFLYLSRPCIKKLFLENQPPCAWRTYTKAMKRRYSMIVFVIVLLILDAFIRLFGMELSIYRYFFNEMGESAVFLRFVYSVVSRLVVVGAALCMMWRREIARKIIVWMSLFTIFTIYWRHPFYVFEKIAATNQQLFLINALIYKFLNKFKLAGVAELDKLYPLILRITISCIDVLLALFVLFVMTRPKIKKLFLDRNEKEVVRV